jgi:DNA-binding IclR family transcriptional regulator
MEGSVTTRSSDAASGFSGIAAVDHAVILLKTIAASAEPLGVNELARRLGLHKSTVSRLLRTLELHHFIRRDVHHGRISLGLGVVALAGPMLGEMDAIAVGRPILKRIAAETGETVSLALWNGREAVMVEQVLGTRTVVHYTWRGKAVPAYSTAVGKIFLAFLPEPEVRLVLAGPLQKFTQFTITEPEALAAELDRVRRRGYALNIEENELESCGVAAPSYDLRGNVAAVLNVAIPKYRFAPDQQEQLAEVVLKGARDLSAQLGYAG